MGTDGVTVKDHSLCPTCLYLPQLARCNGAFFCFFLSQCGPFLSTHLLIIPDNEAAYAPVVYNSRLIPKWHHKQMAHRQGARSVRIQTPHKLGRLLQQMTMFGGKVLQRGLSCPAMVEIFVAVPN